MSTHFITTTEYANKIKKCHPSGVRRAVKEKKLRLLPGVISIKKIGRDNLLEVIT